MSIRKANINDLSYIMNMYKSCVHGMLKHGVTQWDKTYPNTQVVKQDIIAKTYYVFIEKKIIIGGINIDRKQDPAYLNIKWNGKNSDFLVVHRLGVMYNCWNKKVGKKLMFFAEKLAKEKKLNFIRLDTYSGNPKAIAFYQHLNYKNLGPIFLKPNKNEYYCFEKNVK